MQPPDFEDPLDSLDSYSEKRWATVPEPIRKDVEQHVLTNLPDNLLTRLRDVHARGIPISSEDAFFHFGGGMVVRNLCRERLTDDKLASYCLFGDWDTCYIEVLAAIAAAPSRTCVNSAIQASQGTVVRDVVARNILRLGAEPGLSQEALAHECGINRTYLRG